MKRKFVLFAFVCLLFVLFGCAANDNGLKSEPPSNEGVTEDNVMYSSERKMIYNVSASLYIEDNFKEKVDSLKASINEDEWTDYEDIDDYSANITFRIKTSGLDEFVDSLSSYGKVKSLNKKAIDISLKYQDTSNQIIALEAEKGRLIELFDEANMVEIIQINTRISAIDKDLRVLKGEIILYDSQIEYSEVQVSIYNEAPEEDELSYGQKLNRSLKSGFYAFIKFFEIISLVLVTVFPFILLFGLIGLGVYYIRKLYLHKKKGKLK